MRGTHDQQAYDRGTSMFSPDGRLYQVEYARRAVERGGPVVGVCATDSVVLVGHAPRRSPLLDPSSVEKLHDVDGRVGVGTAGHVADGRLLVDTLRRSAQLDRVRYGEPASAGALATAIAEYVQEATQSGRARPFGAALLLAGVDDGSARLYEIDPSGAPSAWRATAIGNGAGAIREFMESAYHDGLAAFDDDFDRDSALALAIESLSTVVEEELSPIAVDAAIVTADRFEALSTDRRRAVLDEHGPLDGAS